MVSTRYRDANKRFRKPKKLKLKFTGEKPSKLLYTGVGMIALFKDALDLAIGLIPGVVTVVAFCLTFLIWMLLFLFDKSGKAGNLRILQTLILVLLALFEGLGFGLNYLPVETLTVFVLYKIMMAVYKKEQKKHEGESVEKTKAERIEEQREAMIQEEEAEQREAEAMARGEMNEGNRQERMALQEANMAIRRAQDMARASEKNQRQNGRIVA